MLIAKSYISLFMSSNRWYVSEGGKRYRSKLILYETFYTGRPPTWGLLREVEGLQSTEKRNEEDKLAFFEGEPRNEGKDDGRYKE